MTIPADHTDEVRAALAGTRQDQAVSLHLFTPNGAPIDILGPVYVRTLHDNRVDIADVTGQPAGTIELAVIGGVTLHNTGDVGPGGSG